MVKLKNKSFITVLATLFFFAAYYFVFFKAQEVINKIMVNAVVYGENVKNKAYPVYMFGRIGEGDISAMLIYTVVIVILCALIYRVLSGSFINIVTSNNTVSKVRYKEKKSKMKNQFAAVLSKEFARFCKSELYVKLWAWLSVSVCIRCGVYRERSFACSFCGYDISI